MSFKVDDWVIYEYHIVQVTEMDNKRVVEVKDGNFCTSGWELEVRPLTLRNKRIADSIAWYREEMYKLPGHNALNWPDINRYLTAQCYQIIDGEDSKTMFDKVKKFYEDMKTALEVRDVQGVRLFRSR